MKSADPYKKGIYVSQCDPRFYLSSTVGFDDLCSPRCSGMVDYNTRSLKVYERKIICGQE